MRNAETKCGKGVFKILKFCVLVTVEKLFKVEVLKVTTSIVKGKRKRNRTGLYKRSNYKKAFITLGKDSEIQLEGIN